MTPTPLSWEIGYAPREIGYAPMERGVGLRKAGPQGLRALGSVRSVPTNRYGSEKHQKAPCPTRILKNISYH